MSWPPPRALAMTLLTEATLVATQLNPGQSCPHPQLWKNQIARGIASQNRRTQNTGKNFLCLVFYEIRFILSFMFSLDTPRLWVSQLNFSSKYKALEFLPATQRHGLVKVIVIVVVLVVGIFWSSKPKPP